MNEYTKKVLVDNDITIERLEKRLILISDQITKNNKFNLTDINIICEEIFGKILNRLYGYKLVALTAKVSSNYVAIDLLDKENKIAYQVTSVDDRKKITDTVKKFKENELYKYADKLYILILKYRKHSYRRKSDSVEDIDFSTHENVINLCKLIEIIKEKSQDDKNIVTDMYDYINMIFDSGRLSYDSIVETTSAMLEKNVATADLLAWEKGYGDIMLHAYIPRTYEQKLACWMEFRQNNLSGIKISFNQDDLINNYLVLQNDFEEKHIIGRKMDEEDCWIDIGNLRMKINAHTAYHIYLLFNELKEKYSKQYEAILEKLGANGLKRINNSFLIGKLSREEWNRIVEFAQKHEWIGEDGESEWNIFNYNDFSNTIDLLSNKHRGGAVAVLSAQFMENDVVNVLWSHGSYGNSDCMEWFYNDKKWKADYTRHWLIEILLPKIEKEINNKKRKLSSFLLLELKNMWKKKITR